MKIFVFLFCLIVAIAALPVQIDEIDPVGIEFDGVPIEDQNEDLVGAESARGGHYGGRGGHGGHRGGGGGHYGGGGYGGGHYGGHGRGGGHGW